MAAFSLASSGLVTRARRKGEDPTSDLLPPYRIIQDATGRPLTGFTNGNQQHPDMIYKASSSVPAI